MSDTPDNTTFPELPIGLVIVEKMTQFQAPKPLELDNHPIVLPPGVYHVFKDYSIIMKMCNIEDYVIEKKQQ